MRRNDILARAREAIGDITPLPADCGLLCGAACCCDPPGDLAGDGVEFGMVLFPGEAYLYRGKPGFRIERAEYIFSGDYRPQILLCVFDGECQREKRPLACRIFPLAPLASGDGTVKGRMDPRAGIVCPLSAVGISSVDGRFLRAVERAFRILSRDKRSLEFMRGLSGELDAIERFTRGRGSFGEQA